MDAILDVWQTSSAEEAAERAAELEIVLRRGCIDILKAAVTASILPLLKAYPITHDRRGNAAIPQPGTPAPGVLAGAAHPPLIRSGAGPFEDGDA